MISPRPSGRTRLFPFLLLGCMILSGAVWVFLQTLHGVYGRYDLADLVPTRNIFDFSASAGRAGILDSRYSEQLLPEGKSWVIENVNAWKRFFASGSMPFDVLDDQAVEGEKLEGYSLLVLPGARSLSDAEVDAIRRFIDRGGSVFATGGTATFTESGEWRGWDFFSKVFGLQFTREISAFESTRLHTLRGELPITAGIPSGYSLQVATWDNPIACKVLEPRTTQASSWYNFRSDSGLTRESIESTAGIAYGTYGRGKFVWMGFELNSVLLNQDDYVYFDVLCRRCVDWLNGQPTVHVHDWPSGYSAAALVAAPFDHAHNEDSTLFAFAQAEQLPISLFISAGAGKTPGLPNPLPSHMEEGIDGTHPAEGIPKILLPILAREPGKGILLAGGAGDEATLRSLIGAGYSYVVTDSMLDRTVPAIIDRDDKPLVVFSKTARTDDEVVRQFGLRDTALQLYTYREDIDRILFQGGLYQLQIHGSLQARPEYIRVISDLARYLRQKNVWIATGSELARWWLARKSLEVSIHTMSPRRLALLVTNASARTIDGAVIQLNINKPVKNIGLTSDILGTDIPPFRYNPGTQIMEIAIPSLKGGTSLSLFVDFDQPTV